MQQENKPSIARQQELVQQANANLLMGMPPYYKVRILSCYELNWILEQRGWNKPFNSLTTATEYPDFRDVDMCYVNIGSVKLSYANFQNASLRGVISHVSHFNRTNFQDADLSFADFTNSEFVLANLVGVNLTHANLNSVNFLKSNLQASCLIEADLTKANLYGTNLIYADLTGANLTRANMYRAKLVGAIANHANFDSTKITMLDLEALRVNH